MSPEAALLMRTLIVGIGNPLRGDNGLGWDVDSKLSSELRRDDVHVLATHQLSLSFPTWSAPQTGSCLSTRLAAEIPVR